MCSSRRSCPWYPFHVCDWLWRKLGREEKNETNEKNGGISKMGHGRKEETRKANADKHGGRRTRTRRQLLKLKTMITKPSKRRTNAQIKIEHQKTHNSIKYLSVEQLRRQKARQGTKPFKTGRPRLLDDIKARKI